MLLGELILGPRSARSRPDIELDDASEWLGHMDSPADGCLTLSVYRRVTRPASGQSGAGEEREQRHHRGDEPGGESTPARAHHARYRHDGGAVCDCCRHSTSYFTPPPLAISRCFSFSRAFSNA